MTTNSEFLDFYPEYLENLNSNIPANEIDLIKEKIIDLEQQSSRLEVEIFCSNGPTSLEIYQSMATIHYLLNKINLKVQEFYFNQTNNDTNEIQKMNDEIEFISSNINKLEKQMERKKPFDRHRNIRGREYDN